MAKSAKKAPRNPPSYFFILCLTVLIAPLINTSESSDDFMNLRISFISSFEINKVNPSYALAALFPLIFLSHLLIAFEIKLITNPGKLSLTKGTATFVSAFYPKLPNKKPKYPLDWIGLDIWKLLSFTSIAILLAITFVDLIVCLVVRSNLSWDS